VAATPSRHGALEAHARDELGIDDARRAQPLQAAWTSALSFSAGAALPLAAVVATPVPARGGATVVVTPLPLGILQLYESVGHGYWEARELEFLTNETNALLEWLRL
jgi:VIT1/CCC1 family predicted Fe2+/Mn2+ transporter